MWNRFKTLDPLLYLIPIVLCGISVVVIHTLTSSAVGSALALRQALFSGLGFVLILLLTFLDYRQLKSWWGWIYAVGVAGLIAVELFGVSIFGAQRWINIGFFQFQPGELEKVFIVICLAAILGRNKQPLTTRTFFFVILLLLVPTIIILMQPDLGTAMVVLVTGFGILFHSRLRRLHLILISVALALGISAMVLSFKNVAPFSGLLKDYQKDRLASFIEPERDQSESGYHVLQSKIAVGSGGIFGKGLGAGSQSQLNFLPVAHADFIFAGIAEAWGLIGSYAIIALYAVLIVRLLVAARLAKDMFGMLICIGIVTKLLFEVLVNIGMNIGIMPVTGIPLPFLSYGGTTMLANAALIGIAQSIVIRYKRLTF